MTESGPGSRFHLVLIKPSHYDDQGYIIQWFRLSIPTNSLAALYGLATDWAARQVLGPQTAITVDAYDETNTRIRVERLAGDIKQAGSGMVGLVGVQSNQYPRAMDLARRFRAFGINAAIGGFHVSGVISMLPAITPELQEAMDLGIALYAGEAEDALDEVLRDAHASKLKPLYNHMAKLPNIAGVPIPRLPIEKIQRTIGKMTTFDAGRGCPFQCSFCTIINVQGRISRRRTPDDIEAIVRHNAANGITSYFITDDNFARNKDWEPIFDRLIQLREQDGFMLKLTIQVDTLCHRIPRFIEKAGRAGVVRVFIGLESINPESLLAAKKKQNRIVEYRDMLLAWKRIRVVIWAGYIIGFPADTPETVLRDIRTIQRELPIDFLEFTIMTPLPGSEDHQKLFLAGIDMDADLNRYDTFHVVTGHPKMTREDWQALYRQAWKTYYSTEHMATLLHRAAATGISLGKMVGYLLSFWSLSIVENSHPMEGGYLRRKMRTERRPGMPIVPVWRFYPAYAAAPQAEARPGGEELPRLGVNADGRRDWDHPPDRRPETGTDRGRRPMIGVNGASQRLAPEAGVRGPFNRNGPSAQCLTPTNRRSGEATMQRSKPLCRGTSRRASEKGELPSGIRLQRVSLAIDARRLDIGYLPHPVVKVQQPRLP